MELVSTLDLDLYICVNLYILNYGTSMRKYQLPFEQNSIGVDVDKDETRASESLGC